jgi:hypothetical protein
MEVAILLHLLTFLVYRSSNASSAVHLWPVDTQKRAERADVSERKLRASTWNSR